MAENDVYVLTPKGQFVKWLLNNQDRINVAIDADDHFDDFDDLYEEVAQIFGVETK